MSIGPACHPSPLEAFWFPLPKRMAKSTAPNSAIGIRKIQPLLLCLSLARFTADQTTQFPFMPANKYALLRYRIIDRCLTNSLRPFPTKEDLRAACEEALYGSDGEHISISTIEKDLWAMRNESELGFFAPIAYHPGQRGYHYTDSDYSINDVSLGDEDLAAIELAAKTLYQFREIPVFSQYASAIEKIVSRLSVSPQMDDQAPAFIQFEQHPSIPGMHWFDAIVRAIQDKAELAISHQKFGSNLASEYTLHPYLLKEYRNRWYVIGFTANRGEVRTYGLERITALERMGQAFEVVEGFDPDTYFTYSIGITVLDESPQDVRIRVSHRQAPYVQSQPLHASQREVENGENGVTFSLHVLLTFELISQLLGMGDQVEVLRPRILREHVRTLATRLADQHS